MEEYHFTLHYRLANENEDPEQQLDALYEAGCSDALIGVGRPGYISFDFSRSGESLEETVNSARDNIHSCLPDAELLVDNED